MVCPILLHGLDSAPFDQFWDWSQVVNLNSLGRLVVVASRLVSLWCVELFPVKVSSSVWDVLLTKVCRPLVALNSALFFPLYFNVTVYLVSCLLRPTAACYGSRYECVYGCARTFDRLV